MACPGQPHPVGAPGGQADVVHEAGQVLRERLHGAELLRLLTNPRPVDKEKKVSVTSGKLVVLVMVVVVVCVCACVFVC